jgi:hypothetical protein
MEDIILFFNSDSCESYLKFEDICREEIVQRGLLLQPGLLDQWIMQLNNPKVHITY